jgi:hypothetical protein
MRATDPAITFLLVLIVGVGAGFLFAAALGAAVVLFAWRMAK